MEKKTEASPLVVFKEESVRLRNEMEAEKDLAKRRVLRFRLKSAKFWERLMEGLIFILLIAILSGCGTLTGLQSDIHQLTRATNIERGQ